MKSSKNIYYNQEISSEQKAFKSKVYNFFYLMINEKNQTKVITLYILHILEIIQLISYAFDEPHLMIWKVPYQRIQIIKVILGAVRINPLILYFFSPIFSIIFYVVVILNFIFMLIIIMQVINRKNNSKIYNGLLIITHILISPLTIFLFLPINEIFLMAFRCLMINKVYKCWTKLHYIFSTLGVISSFFFLLYLIFLNYFYFNPFQLEQTTIKLNSIIDIILIIIKYIYLLNYIFIKNENLSIMILLIPSIILGYKQYRNPVYQNDKLEILLNLRNSLIFWTYFILLLAKCCEDTTINGLFYLLILGYPIIIFCSIIFYKVYKNEFNYKQSSFNNISSCISKTRFLTILINSFINDNRNNLKYNEKGNQKNDILLKGVIKIHTETCLREDCPLTKFINNDGNFNVQKQCLLNYMSIFFNNAIQKFPYSKILRLYFIQFNFSQKYNLNGVKTNLEEIKKMKSDLKEEFIVFCLENEILKMKIKNSNDGSEIDQEDIFIELNYKRLKELISNSTKLYVEFWGIFATNITNNLNTIKLYKIGEKLNVYLKEINNLWENNLKNKKINIENENIAQLYSRFLREIIWANKKSEEIQKKINEEHQAQNFKKLEKKNQQFDNNLEDIIDNQDYLLFVNSNEKGKCNIIQFSNSLSYLIGYQKQELINKNLDVLIPSIFIDGHQKKVEEFIKTMHFQENIEKDSFRGSEKKKTFILIKNKMGYLVPLNAKFSIFDDTDFTNSFIIKAELKASDIKSNYSYYILTNPEFNIEGISSSSIHLGLTMDLLKKYVIKLNILIRTAKDNNLNLFDEYKYYTMEQKKIIWVYPEVIYPKNDEMKNKNKSIQDLIKISNKNKFYLQIFEMKFKEDQIIGFVFKFSEIKKMNKDKISSKELKPPFKNEIIFDLLSLHYIRTVIVKEKSGFRNLREKEDDNKNEELASNKVSERKKRKKKRENKKEEESSSDDEKVEFILTKDKILELQTKDSFGIKSFINLLPFYGNEINLIKHRPNKERYPVGKAQEPSIKIDVNKFIKRLDAKLKEDPEIYKKIKNMKSENRRRESNENNILNNNLMSSVSFRNEINEKNKEDIERDLIGNASTSLMNIFDTKNTKKIRYFDFYIYIFVMSISTIEFILSYIYLSNNIKKFDYLAKSYKIMSNICYTKYFVIKSILAELDSSILPINSSEIGFSKEEYLNNIKSELQNYRLEFTDLFNIFTSREIEYSKEYLNFISTTNISLKTLTNGIPKIDQQPFLIAISKLINAIFYISTKSNVDILDMNNKYVYELMQNLNNGYYMAIEKLTVILLNDFQMDTRKYSIINIILFLVFFIGSILNTFIFWKMMTKLDDDREKPINLFLTIKKKVFEDLKSSSENFSNKLLNKFFGNEENEEESQQEYIANVKLNDINIAKFKALNEYKASSKKASSFIFYFVQILTLFFMFSLLILLKYINSLLYYRNVGKFTEVYNHTHFSHNYLVLRLDIIKQYLFNDSIPNFFLEGKQLSYAFFFYCFLNMTYQFEEALTSTSKTTSFLKKEYKDIFKKYIYSDFGKFIEINNYNRDIILNNSKSLENGFKEISFEIFEILKYISFQYFINSTRNEDNYISDLVFDKSWSALDIMLTGLVKPLYNKLIEVMNSYYYSFVENIKILYISIYIIFVSLLSIYYWIIWKKYEDNFLDLIKKSFDLINLIPEEIKNLIVLKLNE